MFDCVQADQTCLYEVAAHVTSYHLDRSKGYNEVNPGLGLKLKKPEGRMFLAAGAYYNSLDRVSVYGGVGTDLPLAGPFALRLTAGIISGYDIPVAPFLFPELVANVQGYGVAVGCLPKITVGDQVVDAFVSLSVFKRF